MGNLASSNWGNKFACCFVLQRKLIFRPKKKVLRNFKEITRRWDSLRRDTLVKQVYAAISAILAKIFRGFNQYIHITGCMIQLSAPSQSFSAHRTYTSFLLIRIQMPMVWFEDQGMNQII
jgi:hypothetical protein